MVSKTSKPRVAILTSLIDYSPAYSLVGIILDQARMLKRHGYDYDLLCLKAFNMKAWDAEAVSEELSVKYILPQTRLHDYQPADRAKDPHKDENGNLVQGFDQQVATHFNGDPEKGTVGYKDALKDYDVVIDHDLMFLSWHLVQNAALRQCIDLWPDKTWLHWVHSGPSVKPADCCFPSELRFSQAPHSTYVYLNNRQKHDYALMIGAADRDVRVVYNPKDVRDVWGFDELTRKLIDRYDLMDHEILQVYPFSSPRWRDKGVKQLMRIWGFWKRQEVKAKLVLVNAHCNSPKDLPEIEGMEAYAQVCGLEFDKDVILTSRYADETEPDVEYRHRKLRYTVPFRTVRELVMLSNTFIFPTASECCSLIQAEASMAGKFMVLNRDFPPLLEFCTENVMHFEFTRNNPDSNVEYYECVAREILANLRAEASIVNRTKAITQTYNMDWIFENQLEPLLYLGFSNASVPAQPAPREVIRPELAGKTDPMIVVAEESEPAGLIEVEDPSGNVIRMQDINESKAVEKAPTDPSQKRGLDYNNPWPGMDCPIYGKCGQERKDDCYREAGHCPVLDEIDHEEEKKKKAKSK